MKTISLRFGEHFAPPCGTIAAHQEIIDRLGFVWYGKFGAIPSKAVIDNLLKTDNPVILLINSGKYTRYWAKIEAFTTEQPSLDEMPAYYGEYLSKMRSWFKIVSFEDAERDVMSKCIVASSKSPLSEASRHSMSPYFIIEYDSNN